MPMDAVTIRRLASMASYGKMNDLTFPLNPGWLIGILIKMVNWLVVSTHLKDISQKGNLPQTGVKIKKYLKPPPS